MEWGLIMGKKKYDDFRSYSLFNIYANILGQPRCHHKDLAEICDYSTGTISELTNQLKQMSLITIKNSKIKGRGCPQVYVASEKALAKFIGKRINEKYYTFVNKNGFQKLCVDLVLNDYVFNFDCVISILMLKASD